MYQRIGIRMADKSQRVWYLEATKNQPATFCKRMDVISDADSHAASMMVIVVILSDHVSMAFIVILMLL
jgi:hypothetical protein